MRFNPTADDTIKDEDTLIVLGSQQMIKRLRAEGCRA